MSYLRQIEEDFDRFKDGLPKPLEEYVLDHYGVSLESIYGKHTIRNPFGKASGQLSLNVKQIERDVEAGLGFVVLKTVIAEDETGSQSMSAWATQDTHMTVEEILGTRADVAGQQGYTVTWKGRGWGGSLESYLELFDRSLEASADTLVIPSCKYNLPKPEESEWKTSEYRHTTAKLEEIWRKHSTLPMPIEKDFSPTLAGDGNFSREKENILRWLSEITTIIRTNAGDLSLGIKMFNAGFEDDLQLEMLKVIEQASPDHVIYGNRLFDPQKIYEDKQGVAFGGPDLSSRNLWALTEARRRGNRMQISATGNIVSGEIMFEYLRRGCSSFQMHTLFQLPDKYFASRGRNKTERAMHHLLFHPVTGFLKCILDEKLRNNWPDGISIGAMAEYYRDRSPDSYQQQT
jgi:dihydroorotate dehydrogenase